MPKLILNYMRLLSSMLFLIVSIAILFSFYILPRSFAVSFADFYSQYWHLLNMLFATSVTFLAYAFYVEHTKNHVAWVCHILAVIFFVYFIYEFLHLLKVADVLFAVLV